MPWTSLQSDSSPHQKLKKLTTGLPGGAMQSWSTELSAEPPGSDWKAKFHSDILTLPLGVHLRWMKLGFQTSKHNYPVPEEIVSRN